MLGFVAAKMSRYGYEAGQQLRGGLLFASIRLHSGFLGVMSMKRIKQRKPEKQSDQPDLPAMALLHSYRNVQTRCEHDSSKDEFTLKGLLKLKLWERPHEKIYYRRYLLP